jgi:hydroxymethylbilane synthase
MLALWQAEFIKDQLLKITDRPVILKIIKTAGDKIDNLSFSKMEGKGFFTKEIEEALIENEIDLAVHSLKDLMTTLPEGLTLPAVGFREDNREILLIRKESYIKGQDFPVREKGVIGSSSVRRQCQIAHMAPDLKIKDLRGNVPTRIRKLCEGKYDAIILAYAGILRLNIDLSDLKTVILPEDEFLPAPGQGILAVQGRDNNDGVNQIVKQLDDSISRLQMKLERGLLGRFEGGCQLPLGVSSKIDGEKLQLNAVLGIRNGEKWIDLRRKTAAGADPDEVIDETFTYLTG